MGPPHPPLRDVGAGGWEGRLRGIISARLPRKSSSLMPRVRRWVSEVWALIQVTGVPPPARRIRFSRSMCLALGGLVRGQPQLSLSPPLYNQRPRPDPLSRSRASVTARSSAPAWPVTRLKLQERKAGSAENCPEPSVQTLEPINGFFFFCGDHLDLLPRKGWNQPMFKKARGPGWALQATSHHASTALICTMVGCPRGPATQGTANTTAKSLATALVRPSAL